MKTWIPGEDKIEIFLTYINTETCKHKSFKKKKKVMEMRF